MYTIVRANEKWGVYTIEADGYTILNVSAYALACRFLVWRFCDDQAWFYGACNTMEEALDIATQVSGHVTQIND